MTEREEPPQEGREQMRMRAESLIRRFELLDGHIGMVMYEISAEQDDPVSLVEHDSHDAFFAASTNKLAIAFALSVERCGQEMRTQCLSGQLDGAGRYDKQDDAAVSVVTVASEEELLEDMLRHSGNTAAKVLKEAVGAERINRILKEHGLHEVQLTINPDGTSHLGYATPDGLARLLCATVKGGEEAHGGLIDTARHALLYNDRPTGIRTGLTEQNRALLLGDGVQIFNKSGEYNGDDEVGAPVRHDVGLIVTDDGRHTAYAVMCQSKPAVLAEYTRHQMTAAILEYASGIELLRPPAQLARKALSNLGIGKKKD